ncbi:MmcQ/YjbR family DNA-binding protein [Rhabdobacter roseus]|uniref:Putative DNA-binding protein (MmcQ/YjbR family) n=1 Tax=Rhabdobacter roseus TaxID=1655419 RepID=A0A840TT80_9BACT|nr:MmcQ/YjbR family DNA-binding protein [Rhabdobacter roseus]MBB5283210.1 putative DNA-binding protein (MmcQ/YjbR family) [Rhabdobacter roseus]
MNIETLRDYCLSLTAVEEYVPFGNDTLAFRVKDKIFLLTTLNLEVLRFNVKCEPEKAEELREQYPSVKPGYHMNKKHWNTVIVDGSVPDTLLHEWIRDSYELIVAALPKKDREALTS